MKKDKEKVMRLAMYVLGVFAVLFGGGCGMAIGTIDYTDPKDRVDPQIGNEGPGANTSQSHADVDNSNATVAANPGSDHEPVDQSVNDRYGPGGRAVGQDLAGSQASSTQITKGGLQEDEWDTELITYKPFRNPLWSIIRKCAKKVNVSNYSVKHFRCGGETLEVVVTSTIPASPSNLIKLTSSNTSGSLRPFYKGSTVFANGKEGYAPGSNSEKRGELMLFVVDSDKSGVTLSAVNGPAATNNVVGDELDYVTCPAIEAGTILSCGATAASESQLQISPENFQPRPFEVYVQKKLMNIVTTEDFNIVKKKRPLEFRDLKEDALYKYLMRSERTYWRGVKSRFNVQNADGSVEYVYTSEGILWQLTNSYGIDSDYTLADLIAISKLQFTDFAQNDRAFVFCGKDAMSSLLNINPGDNRRIVFDSERLPGLDLDFRTFKTTFGTLYFVYAQTLDMLHMEDCMVVLDVDNAIRYVKIASQEKTNDMSKGGAGEIRDARRYIKIEADCVALRGYNSILVGPKSKIFSLPMTENMNRIISSDSFPENPTAGMLVFLTEDYTVEADGEDPVTYTANTVYTYDSDDGWVPYTGLMVAGAAV